MFLENLKRPLFKLQLLVRKNSSNFRTPIREFDNHSEALRITSSERFSFVPCLQKRYPLHAQVIHGLYRPLIHPAKNLNANDALCQQET